MVLEIASIQDTKLHKIADKIDNRGNNNGRIDQSEIGELLTKMTKNKYCFEDFKNLLGENFNNLPNEEKLNIYQNCYDKLQDSMHFAESTVKDGENIDCCFGKELLKFAGISSAIGACLKSGLQDKFSFKNTLKGGLLGAVAGFGLASLACLADKSTYERSKEKCIIKDDTLQKLESEMNQLKEVA